MCAILRTLAATETPGERRSRWLDVALLDHVGDTGHKIHSPLQIMGILWCRNDFEVQGWWLWETL